MARIAWFFNTDESEKEGKGAYQKMIDQSCIAAWGECRGNGAEATLNKPGDGDIVFLYRAGFGVVASATCTGESSFKGKSIFN